MNRFEGVSKPLMWFMALLLVAFAAGCGNTGGNVSTFGLGSKAITAYSLAGNTGVVNESAKIISVTVPYGKNVTALVATFTTTGKSVKVGTTTQVSGTTTNNFTGTVNYIVTAADGTTATYSVVVTVAAASSKAMSAFSFVGYAGASGAISGAASAYAIAVTVPYGTAVTALKAAFTTSGTNVKVGALAQTSGTTANDFTSPVAYIVTAADGTTATYNVTVSVASITAKAITAYSLSGVAGTISGTSSPYAIAVTVPYGTVVTNLIATFATTGSGVKVGTTAQTSGTTANDFTAPVAYIVTAGDASTATYNVTVTVAAASSKAITAYSLGGVAGVISGGASPYAIAVNMPAGTDVTNLIATFSSTGHGVPTVAGVNQLTGATPNDFTSPVAYIVTASDASTATYNVTVTIAAMAAVNLHTAANFVILTKTGITDVPSSVITGNIGASPVTGSAIQPACGEVTGFVYAVDPFYAGGAGCVKDTASDKTTVDNAVLDMGTAYTDAAGRTAGVGPNLNLGGGTVTAQTLVPGVYTWGSNVLITGDITLNGGASDVWIFQITGTLGDAASKIILTGGALAKNVFWQVSSTVSLGGTAQFTGVILAQTNITLVNGASISGRMLAQAAVTLDHNTVTQPAP